MHRLGLSLGLAMLGGCGSDDSEGKGAMSMAGSAGASSQAGSSSQSGGGGLDAGSGGSGSEAGSGGKPGKMTFMGDPGTGGHTMDGPGTRPCGPARAATGVSALTSDAWTDISPGEAKLGINGDEAVFTQGIAVDPSNPGTVYVALAGNNNKTFQFIQGGLCKSTDSGATWSLLGNFDQPLDVVVDPEDPLHLYVGDGVRGGTFGFWSSVDGGQTWVQPQAFVELASSVRSADVYHIEPNPEDFNHVLVSFHGAWHDCQDFGFGGCTSGIIESFDGGGSWTLHQPPAGWAGKGGFAVFMLYNPELGLGDPKTWLVGTQGAGYWRTTDGGESWRQVSDASMSHGGAQIYYSKTGDLFVGAELTPLVSSDNGATWTKLNMANGVPAGYYFALYGDGTSLFTSSNGTQNGFISALESNNTSWSVFNDQKFAESTFEFALDRGTGILYASIWAGGVLARRTE
ncbi:MAG TPA: hypothetical protein VJN18_23365 [Polyangiaceae bacterium]|nr:hypothetical protein [Polyangiaceae bacterium]